MNDSGEDSLPSSPQDFVTLHQFSESLGTAIDVKDDLTHNHSQEVAEMALLIAQAMRLDTKRCEAIHIAGHLHDIGKIGTSDSILKKAGPLTDSEWAEMQEHPTIGYTILKPVKALTSGEKIAEMVLHHHERFDGTGYPHNLKAEKIPLGSRIIAVADSMSAMLGNRRYRTADPWQKAADEILRCSGSQFDPQVVEAFWSLGNLKDKQDICISHNFFTPQKEVWS